ncbi:MAG: AI-2E family transporter [Balneolaceae bacterium]|nr:AI-2E family transporter [Balneolaceae bacterium]
MPKNIHSWLSDRGQLVLLTGGVLALLFLMYQLDHLINPLGYGLIIGIVLYPIRQQPVARALLYATAFAAGLWLVYDSGHLLVPFIVAYIIAFIINPLVEKLEKRRIPRGLIAGMFTVGCLGLLTMIVILTVPAIMDQLSKLGTLMNEASTNTEAWVESTGLIALFDSIGFESSSLKSELVNQINSIIERFYQDLTDLSSGYLTGVGSAVAVLFFIILTPFLCFFMIRDYQKIGIFVRSLITPSNVSTDYTTEIGRIVGAYLRGQFIVVLISSVNLSLGFYLLDVPYALVLGIFSGLTNFIPTFGLWFSVSICTLVGASFGDPWYQYLPAIYLVFGIEQILESGFIVPRVVGKHVGLHPLLVMVSLLFFGFMLGIVGLLIAVPTVALISVFYQQYKETRKISFLSGSELDTFIQQFDRETKKQQKKQKMEKELESTP